MKKEIYRKTLSKLTINFNPRDYSQTNCMKKIRDVFDQVGYIINQYVPELYKFYLFKGTHIISIIDEDSKHAQGFEKYTNLKYLVMDSFEGNLSPFAHCPLLEIRMLSFNGDLSPLGDCPLQKINIYYFKGNLSPLKKCPLVEIFLASFDGDLTPLRKCPIQTAILYSFRGDLTPIIMCPLVYIDTPLMDGFDNVDEFIKFCRENSYIGSDTDEYIYTWEFRFINRSLDSYIVDDTHD